MSKHKFLHVSTADSDNSNIAVLDLGKLDIQNSKVDFEIKKIAEPKMVKALSEHFDCEIKVISINYIDTFPITLEVDVIVCAEEEDYQTTVFLNETWVY